jgi:hypothetical protein
MRVLVIEDRDQEAQAAVDALREAGHEVSYCHEPGDGALDCNGMPDRAGCPLDHGGIDVAVLGRTPLVGDADQTTTGEAGAGCAKRHRVPVVITGKPGTTTAPPWAADIVPADHPDLVDRIDAAARQGRLHLVEAAEGAARAVLDGAGMSATPLVGRVVREDRRLRVTIDVAGELDDRLRETIGVRVVGAVRAIETATPSVDVQVLGTT